VEYEITGPRYLPCEIYEIDIKHRQVRLMSMAQDPGRLRLDRADHCEECAFMALSYHIHRTVGKLDELEEYEASRDGGVW
jgi:hypothetical protein